LFITQYGRNPISNAEDVYINDLAISMTKIDMIQSKVQGNARIQSIRKDVVAEMPEGVLMDANAVDNEVAARVRTKCIARNEAYAMEVLYNNLIEEQSDYVTGKSEVIKDGADDKGNTTTPVYQFLKDFGMKDKAIKAI
ncbi:MAG: hypothetical protein CUN55_19390, partial [Phototrophicales bacterium]